jgi:hypothetical protein
MEKVTDRLDKIANSLEALGLSRLAYKIDVVSNTLEKTASKYNHIDFKPPQGVADAAARGLEIRAKASPSNKGGLSTSQAKEEGVGSGVQRAVNLKNRDTLSPATVRRMNSFFSRHEKNKGIDKGKAPETDKGYQAWLLWGGDAGAAWARKLVKQMDAADDK